MAKIKLDIKKELTEEEFKNLISECEIALESNLTLEKMVAGCEKKVKEIIPANSVYILKVTDDLKFYAVTSDQYVALDTNKESILSECYKTKQPLIVHDVSRSFLYNEKIDNFAQCSIQEILLVPVLDDSDEKRVVGIIWTAIMEGSWNQYTQVDLDYISRFSNFVKISLQERRVSNDLSVKKSDYNIDYKAEFEKLTHTINKNQEYFSSIIHDIRTPMNAVVGFLELLNLREIEKDKKEYIQTALKSSQTMINLINDALDISKISSGSMSIECIEFSVYQELSDVSRLFFNNARKKDVVFIAYYDPKLPSLIYSDYHRIKQIMNNLLSNAIKFTPKGGKIILELIYDKESDGLLVSITDNGIGIKKEMQESIFSPYIQEKTSTAREYGGTGLGLSISQQLAVLLGGKLELKSKEGSGSKFFFTIPCCTKSPALPELDLQKFKNLSVLFYCSKTDDHEMQSVRRYFKDFNIEQKEIGNNIEVDEILKHSFDILIISREVSTLFKEEIQSVLEKNKPLIIVGNGYLSENYHWFTGNVRRINTPILPQELYETIDELIFFEEIESKKQVTQENIDELKTKKILVVDDNIINLKFMTEVLKSMKMSTQVAQDAKESLEKIHLESFDMVFMDENMPMTQGSEVIKSIREYEKMNKRIPSVIVGLTGDADYKTKKKIVMAGANSVLIKPVHIKEIKDVILQYL